MKKIALAIVFLVISFNLVSAREIALHFNPLIGYGLSDFFTERSHSQVQNEVAGTQVIRSVMGFGAHLGVSIQVTNRLYVIPEGGIIYGHQSSKFVPTSSDVETTSTYSFFHIYTAGVNVNYEFCRLPNNWAFTAQSGLGYNYTTADASLGIDATGHLGWQIGIGALHRNLGRTGLQAFVFYKTIFGDTQIAYLAGSVGIFYRL